MINNFELIKPFLDFKSKDDFYFVQVLQRKKDNPGTKGTNNSARLISAYYIKSLEHLEQRKEEMIALAELYNARVCINLNKRSFEKSAWQMLRKVTEQILNKDYHSVRRAYNNVCGQYMTGDKSWLIDIDKEDVSNGQEILDFIETLKPDVKKFIGVIPSKSGYHLITKPFELHKFREKFPDIDVHKNNPTILYIPNAENDVINNLPVCKKRKINLVKKLVTPLVNTLVHILETTIRGLFLLKKLLKN